MAKYRVVHDLLGYPHPDTGIATYVGRGEVVELADEVGARGLELGAVVALDAVDEEDGGAGEGSPSSSSDGLDAEKLAAMTVSAVEAYLREHPDEVGDVLTLEAAGRGRAGVEALRAQFDVEDPEGPAA
jgi:hypothetical protein